MTEREHMMSFGEWLNATKGLNVNVDTSGHISPRRKDLEEKYFQEYLNESRDYESKKHEHIAQALAALKAEGIKCKLMCQQNGHINAVTKHGIILAYYATTGTIAGYDKKTYAGLDSLIELCKE